MPPNFMCLMVCVGPHASATMNTNRSFLNNTTSKSLVLAADCTIEHGIAMQKGGHPEYKERLKELNMFSLKSCLKGG